MSLFHIPGWSVQNTPVPGEFRNASRKRKHPSSHDSHTQEIAEVDINKLTSKLKHIEAEPSDQRCRTSTATLETQVNRKAEPGSRNRSQGFSDIRCNEEDIKFRPVQAQKQNRPSDRYADEVIRSEAFRPPKKMTKTKPLKPSLSRTGLTFGESGPPSVSAELTALQRNMKDKLEGARFRLINENLYKSDSRAARQMLRTDPKIFEEYHAGFRHQVLSWPTNPVQHYISLFESYPPKTVIADLGCGDALLAKSLIPKGMCVVSFDLVSDNGYVVEADICERIPLPGSEVIKEVKSAGEGQVVDVVVCALSLMGVNWPMCLREAWRILKPGGELHIAEVASRFTDIESFLNLLKPIGFRLKAKDETNTHFILFEFVKIPRSPQAENKLVKLSSRGGILRPCEYKRR